MISTILSSSVLILMIIIIRFVFQGKINPMLQYGLWGLVALRLIVFSWLNLYPIESSLSIMNLAGNVLEAIRQASSVEQVMAGKVEAAAIDNAVLVIDNVRTGVMTSGNGISAAAAVDWQLVIMIVWAIGTVAVGLWLIFVNCKFGKKISEKRVLLKFVQANNRRTLDFEGITLNNRPITDENSKFLPVYVVDGLGSPCLMKYKGEEAIYINSEVAAEKEMLRYAIAHELCHYEHYDLIWSLVRSGMLAFYWFNPLVWIAAIISKRDCELACDYEVIKKIGKENRLAYGKTIVDFIGQREQKDNVLRVSTSMYGSANGLKDRVNMIVKDKKMKTSTLIAVLLITALSVSFTFTSAVTDEKDLLAIPTEQVGIIY